MKEIQIHTPEQGFIDVTDKVNDVIAAFGRETGLCQVFVPHTTAGLTINENADPDVIKDMREALDEMVPHLPYSHAEGNSPAHIKSSLMGCSLTIPIQNGSLCLGTWQGVYFCEFDGPRRRSIWVTIV
jgi:secondary thiamine-phosphate synthase enzyme